MYTSKHVYVGTNNHNSFNSINSNSMKNLLNLAILTMLMATPVFFVSCGDDDDMLPEESEISKPTITSWTEPIHENGASIDDVKSYMASSMFRYALVNETAGISSLQLTYATGYLTEGVIYSFSGTPGSLYSVIDTELMVNKDIIFKYLNDHYTVVPGSASNETLLMYNFTNSDRTIIITTKKVSETCFNINYTFVSK